MKPLPPTSTLTKPMPAAPLLPVALLLLAALLTAGPVAAQEAAQEDGPNRFPVVQDGQWGYIDSTGAMAIAPQFDEAEPFSDGWARVKRGEAFAFIDPAGEGVLEPEVFYVGSFSEGRAVVRPEEGGTLGYLDKSGQVVIAPQFAEAYPFSEGRAAVYTGTPERAVPKYGYIDADGAFVIEPQFWGARRFAGGLAPVLVGGFVDGKWAFIDEGGATVIEPQFESALRFSEGHAAVSVGDHFDAKWGYIDEQGRQVVEPKHELARAFSGGVAPVKDAFDDWRYLDAQGEEALPKKYAYAEPFRGPLARVAAESGGGGRGSQGGTVEFYSGVADADWRYIDRQGRRVWPASFGTATATYQALGFRVHYPANWTASWGRWDDPFAGGERSAHSFQRVQSSEAAPAEANALMFSGDEAPQGLMVFAHRAAHRPLPALVEVLRSSRQAMSSGSRAPDYTMNASVAWGNHPASEIAFAGGLGGRSHLLVRADGVRYVATCRNMMGRNCWPAFDEHVELELLNGAAEPVGEAEKQAIADARPPEDPLVATLSALLPAVAPDGLERKGVEKRSAGGGQIVSALYMGEGTMMQVAVALLGDEKLNETRSELEAEAGSQAAVRKKQHRGRTVYEESTSSRVTLTLFLDGGAGLMVQAEKMDTKKVYALLDVLDLKKIEALVAER